MSSTYPSFYVTKSRGGASTTAVPFAPAVAVGGIPNGTAFTVTAGSDFTFTTPSGISTALFGFTPGATVLIGPDPIDSPSGSPTDVSYHVNPAVRALQSDTQYYGYAVDDTVVCITYYST